MPHKNTFKYLAIVSYGLLSYFYDNRRAFTLMDQLQLQLDGETDGEEDSLDVAIV